MQDSEMIQHSVDQRRAHMAGALAELSSRMSVKYVAGVATRSATPALAGAAPLIARLAMRKPVGSALLSAGLGYLLFGNEPDLKNGARRVAHKVSEQGRSLGEVSADLLDKVQSVAARTSAAASDASAGLLDKVQSVAAQTSAMAQGTVRDLGRTLRPTPKEFSTATTLPLRNPRPAEMGALAFGAAFALGLVLLPSRKSATARRSRSQPPIV
jgi:hypothetical protein